jgi:predicted PurR-regulated permease PerM
LTTTASRTDAVRQMGSTVSLRVIACAVILTFCYYAAGVVITLLLSILIAYFLDPAVDFLERLRLPRMVGALVMVIVLIAGVAGIGYILWMRAADFADNWPRYSVVLKQGISALDSKIQRIEGGVTGVEKPQQSPASPTLPGPAVLQSLLLRGANSLYALFLEATFVPFLVFFMLAAKRDLWHGTLQLFPVARRTQVKETLDDLREVLRNYLAGMTLVTLVVMIVSAFFFWLMELDYPMLTGIVSGLFNMVPYLGAVLAWVPPMIIGLTKWKTIGPFFFTAVVLLAVHIFALNLLAPSLVGRRVRLNAVAITIALLFWGWVWGGMGLILAIPITATLRVVCDHTESWKPIGRWLSA